MQPEAPIACHFLSGEQQPDYIRDELLHEIFATTAVRLPQSVAICCDDKKLTYSELLVQARKVAHYLRRIGVKRGHPVVLWMPRCLEMYIGMLAILEAGGVYVPLDPDYPAERVAYAARDCEAVCVFSCSEQISTVKTEFTCDLVLIDKIKSELARLSAHPVTRDITGTTPEDCAYILYTSGSTGRPKGVMISHRSICHLVRSEGSILELDENDRVFQGFSLSFDMSLEEIWPAWAAGATLLTGTREMMQVGSRLAALLEQEKITVWHCVPTLLALQETSVSTLRILNLGGEACPPELVRRWSHPSLRILNTYGPTETTITATAAVLAPGKPITIGKLLPNYTAILLDERLRPVPAGKAGELCIGGPGLALGYIGRSDLTAERFITFPISENDSDNHVVYRTGDLVRVTDTDEFEFLGRIDTQIKIRGFRVELSEIEHALLSIAPLRHAVVHPWRDNAGVETLVAYLVSWDNQPLDLQALRKGLRDRLPTYMVPTMFEVIEQLPVLASGKVDRKNLPAPKASPLENHGAKPTTAMEKKLHTVWCEVFTPASVSIDDNFFTDLGGHSLRAAAAVSRLRRDPALSNVSMVDVYRYPTIRQFAHHIEQQTIANNISRSQTGKANPRQFSPIPASRYLLCSIAQAFSLIGIFTVFSLQWLIPFLTYAWLTMHGLNRLPAALLALVSFIGAIPIMLAFGIAAKWLVLGRLKPGEYPLWGLTFFRHWLSQRLLATVPIQYLGGTPLLAMYYRLLGARIGHNVYIADNIIDDPDCVSIGDHTSFSPGANIIGTHVDGGKLIVGKIVVGSHCSFGVSSTIASNVNIGDHVVIGDLTMIPSGLVIPENESWSGSPGRKTGKGNKSINQLPPTRRQRWIYSFAFASILPLFPVFAILPFFPGMILMTKLAQTVLSWLLYAPLLAILFIVLMGLQIAVLKWLLIGRIRPGKISFHSFAYVRYWTVSKLMELSLDTMGPFYATLFLNPWYRLLGVRLGKRAEVSTASSISFDLLEIGEEAFIADAVELGTPHVRNGHLIFKRTKIGRRTFVGNCAVVPSGTVLGDGVLIGVLSVPPTRSADARKPDSSWFGTPAVYLPQRQTFQQFDEAHTFHPQRALLIQRALIEGIRILLPLSCTVVLTSAMMSLVVALHDIAGWSLAQIVGVFPLLYLAYGSIAGLFVVGLKWIVAGRYRPIEQPLWSRFVWRSELVTSVYENLAVPFFLEPLRGTPFLVTYLRLLGAKIGRRVYLDTTDFTEYDVVRIGDDAALNTDCGPQTHLFEDRVMKISHVEIGSRCTLGHGSIVLYDAHMESDSSLADLSLLMKGERLPAGTSWEGSPAQRADQLP